METKASRLEVGDRAENNTEATKLQLAFDQGTLILLNIYLRSWVEKRIVCSGKDHTRITIDQLEKFRLNFSRCTNSGIAPLTRHCNTVLLDNKIFNLRLYTFK